MKKQTYDELFSQVGSLLADETDMISAMANVSAAIYGMLDGINWAGFYRVKGGQLVLGPFQGKVACIRIAKGKGVCGTAFAENTVCIVPDVHAFPGHIACDSASNSEIVLPMRTPDGEVFAVMDIDSPVFSRFDGEDADGLGRIIELMEKLPIAAE